jgi:hypothetical protein
MQAMNELVCSCLAAVIAAVASLNKDRKGSFHG